MATDPNQLLPGETITPINQASAPSGSVPAQGQGLMPGETITPVNQTPPDRPWQLGVEDFIENAETGLAKGAGDIVPGAGLVTGLLSGEKSLMQTGKDAFFALLHQTPIGRVMDADKRMQQAMPILHSFYTSLKNNMPVGQALSDANETAKKHDAVLQIAHADLARNGHEDRREDEEGGQALEHRTGDDEQEDRGKHEKPLVLMHSAERPDEALGELRRREHPGKAGRGAEDEEDHAGHRCAVHQAPEEDPEAQLVIHETREEQAIDYREGGDLGRGADAKEDAADEDHGHEQRQDAVREGGCEFLQGRARKPLPPGPAGLKVD